MTRTPDGRGRERRTDTILPSVSSAREHGCPPPRLDRLPPRRGGHPSPHTVNTADRRTGLRAPVSRGRLRFARAFAAAALLALSGALALPATAQAQEIVLLSNLGQTADDVLDGTPVHSAIDFVQGFTTGSNADGYHLASIDLDIVRVPDTPADVTIALWSATSDTEPGASIATLTHSTGTWVTGLNAFSAPADTELDANTTYFVHMAYSRGDHLALRTNSSTSAVGAADWSLGEMVRSISGGNWVDLSSNKRFRLRIDGRASEVTPPLPPRVTSVVVASAPQSGDTYRSYETIVFTVTFSEPVEVKPHGRLRLKVGLDNPGGASGSTVEAVFSGLSQSQRPTADTPQARRARHMHFEYKVQLFDRDEDGVRIRANALRLASGARIQGELGADAELDHAALSPQSDHKVDGTADVPMIRRIEVVSTPRLRSKGTTNRDTYGEGENIRIEVRFDQPVVVEGEPTFALEVGDPCGSVCEARYESGSGTDALVFAYLVLDGDIDRNGIAIPANPIEVVYGNSIRNDADQEAHLSYRRKGTQRGHKVDGSRAAGPYLSVGDAEAHEADGEMEFTVRLEPHGLGIVQVNYATADRTATAGEDYRETSGTLTFNPLETERTVSVPILDDAHEDTGETFTLTLSDPEGAEVARGEGEATGTIHNSEIQPLRATFKDVPAAHDGSAFTFRVAFSEDIGISYRSLREDAFAVTGGSVTRGRRVDDRRDLFEMTVEPDSDGDVTIELPAGRECGVSGAICTKGDNRRQLANTPTATVAGPEAVSADLTASFVGVPEAHDGESAFTLRIAFSEPLSWMNGRRLREDVVAVAGGRATKASRVNRRRDLWQLTVEPNSLVDVTVTLAAGAACGTPAAVCTKDGRALSETISATVAGPVGISVADARVEEGAGAVLEFAVTLSRAAGVAVTVDYATSDGTAQVGVDYTAANGTLTFEAGESSKTVEVAVVDDSHDEGEETMTLRLSNPSEGRLADAEATGTIENTDPLPRALLARFGRATALHVMEQVEERLEASRASGFRGRFAGRELRRGMERDMGRNFLSRLQSTAVAGARDTTGVQSDLSGSELLRRGLGGGDLLIGSGFVLNRETGGGASVSLWSRGMESRFSGRDGELSLDGGVRTTMFGADYAKGPLMAGLMLSHRRGLGGYQGADIGQVASSVTGLHPWVGYQLTERVTLWGVTGYGRGSLSLTPGEALSLPTSLAAPVALEGGLSMSMLAGGVRGDLVDAGIGGFGLAFKADALWVGTGSEAVGGPAGRLAGTEAVVTRVRTALEASRGYVFGHGIALRPSLEVGLRRDGGDAETGAGVDVAGSLIVADPLTGLSVDVRVRTLLVHQDEGFRERGVSVSFSYDPTPSTPLGFTARVAPSWGGQAMSGADALWGRDTMEGLGAAGPGSGDRLDAELGYALPVGSRLVGTPRFGVTTSEYGRDYRLGYSLAVVQGGAMSFQFGLDAQRRESLGRGDADHSLVGRLTVGW